jgi:hypothetical protein
MENSGDIKNKTKNTIRDGNRKEKGRNNQSASYTEEDNTQFTTTAHETGKRQRPYRVRRPKVADVNPEGNIEKVTDSNISYRSNHMNKNKDDTYSYHSKGHKRPSSMNDCSKNSNRNNWRNDKLSVTEEGSGINENRYKSSSNIISENNKDNEQSNQMEEDSIKKYLVELGNDSCVYTTQNTLNNPWNLYFHDPFNSNWDKKSFYNLAKIDSIEKFWDVFNVIRETLHKGMFFLMRDGVFPLWEEQDNSNGGYISFRTHHKDFPELIEYLFTMMISEKMLKNDYLKDYNLVNGISISPKKEFCITRIWLRNMKYDTLDYFGFNTDEAFIKKRIY